MTLVMVWATAFPGSRIQQRYAAERRNDSASRSSPSVRDRSARPISARIRATPPPALTSAVSPSSSSRRRVCSSSASSPRTARCASPTSAGRARRPGSRPGRGAGLVRDRGGELGRAGERGHGGRDGTAPDGTLGDELELDREVLVVPGCRSGPVQDSPVGAGPDGSGQRQVPVRPAGRRRLVVDGRSHQPVAKVRAAVGQLDQAGGDGRLQQVELRWRPGGSGGVEELGSESESCSASRVSAVRAAAGSSSNRAAKAACRRCVSGSHRRQFPPGQADGFRQLEQGERVALGGPEDIGHGQPRQGQGRRRPAAALSPRRRAAQGGAPGPRRLGAGRVRRHGSWPAARPDRAQGGGRRSGERWPWPDPATARPRPPPAAAARRPRPQQVQGRHGSANGSGGGCGDAEGDPQSGLPRLGDQVGQGQERLKQLTEPGHGQAGLRRAAEGPQDPAARAGPPDRLLDQRRLADAGRSSDHDRGAALPVGEGGRSGSARVPADENAAVNNAPHSRHNYRVPTAAVVVRSGGNCCVRS